MLGTSGPPIPPRVTSLPLSRTLPVSDLPSRRPSSDSNSMAPVSSGCAAPFPATSDLDLDSNLDLGSPGPVFHNLDEPASRPMSRTAFPVVSTWDHGHSQDWSISSPVSKRDTPILYENRDSNLADALAAYSQPASPLASSPRVPLEPNQLEDVESVLPNAHSNSSDPVPSAPLSQRTSFEDLHRDLISMSRDDRLYSLILPQRQCFRRPVKEVTAVPSSFTPYPSSPLSRPEPSWPGARSAGLVASFDLSAQSNRIPFSGIDTRHNSVFEDKTLFGELPPLPIPALPPTPTTPRTPVPPSVTLPITPQLSPKTAVFSPSSLSKKNLPSRPVTPAYQSSFYTDVLDMAPVTSPRPEPGQWLRSASSSKTPPGVSTLPDNLIHPNGRSKSCGFCNLCSNASASRQAGLIRSSTFRPTGSSAFEELTMCRACKYEAGFHREKCPLGDQPPFVSVFEDDEEKAGLMEYIRSKCRSRKVSGSGSGSTPEKTPYSWSSSGTTSPNKRNSAATYSPHQSVVVPLSGQAPKSRSQSKNWLHRLSCAVRGG